MNDVATVVAAALAGVPAGVQSLGPWAGRRQLFVRFAGEAETATMYVAPALSRELERQQARSSFHSIVIGGRDPLGSVPFLLAAFTAAKPKLPVMLDTDGQRPEALGELLPFLSLVQVTVEFGGGEASFDRAIQSIGVAAAAKCSHALVLVAKEDTPDSQLLRLVQEVHAVSAETQVVIHPYQSPEAYNVLDRRWATLLEQAVSAHPDSRLGLRLPPPTGLR
jgi:pyruvate-formate lyase-activating enzyme